MPRLMLLVLFLAACDSARPEPWQWQDDASDPNEISVLIMGDTNLQDRQNPPEAFRYVRDTLLAADVRFANLECALAGSADDPLVDDIPHKDWFHAEPGQVSALTSVDMSAVGIANNVNYPWQAVIKSIDVLNEAGIPHTGGGRNIEEAHEPVVLDVDGIRIGFIQYAATVFPFNHAATETRPGIAEIEVHTAYQPPPNLDKPGQPPIVITWTDEESLARMQRDIRNLDNRADIVVASYHWGVSGTTEIVDYQSEVGRAAIDAGADLVVGHGPHRFQKIEIYQGRAILHSIAQFVFDDRIRLGRNLEGLLVRLLIRDRDIAEISLVPAWRGTDNLVRLYSPASERGRELIGYLRSVGEPDGAALTVIGDEIRILGLGAGSRD